MPEAKRQIRKDKSNLAVIAGSTGTILATVLSPEYKELVVAVGGVVTMALNAFLRAFTD